MLEGGKGRNFNKFLMKWKSKQRHSSQNKEIGDPVLRSCDETFSILLSFIIIFENYINKSHNFVVY